MVKGVFVHFPQLLYRALVKGCLRAFPLFIITRSDKKGLYAFHSFDINWLALVKGVFVHFPHFSYRALVKGVFGHFSN